MFHGNSLVLRRSLHVSPKSVHRLNKGKLWSNKLGWFLVESASLVSDLRRFLCREKTEGRRALEPKVDRCFSLDSAQNNVAISHEHSVLLLSAHSCIGLRCKAVGLPTGEARKDFPPTLRPNRASKTDKPTRSIFLKVSVR